jgi:Multiubiquitin
MEGHFALSCPIFCHVPEGEPLNQNRKGQACVDPLCRDDAVFAMQNQSHAVQYGCAGRVSVDHFFLQKARVEMANDERPEITIYVNNEPFKTAERELTGGQIKALAGIPSEYELFRVDGQHTIPVGNDDHIRLHENEQFRAIPSGTFGENGLASQIS